MGMIYCTLIQESQTSRPSTAFLVLVGVLVLAALALAVYLFRRFKRSEKETEEEDWMQGRHTLMLDADQSRPTPPSVASAHSRATEILVSPPKPEVPSEQAGLTVGEQPSRASIPLETKTTSIFDDLRATAVNETDSAMNLRSAVPTAPSALSKETAVSAPEVKPPAQVGKGEVSEIGPAAEPPLAEGIWAQVNAAETQTAASPLERASAAVTEPPSAADLRVADKPPQITPSPERTAPRPTRPEPTPEREPFEPPRIEPIIPRKLAQGKAIISALARPIAQAVKTAASSPVQRLPGKVQPEPQIPYSVAPRVTGDIPRPRPTKFDSAVAVAEPAAAREVTKMAEQRGTAAGTKRAAGGSILGLPSQPSDKPLILGHSPESIEVGTLSSYGKTPSETGGHGGTIFLAVVIGIIALSVAGYLFVPRIHGSVNGWVARMRGTDLADQTPKAQIFTGPPDNTQSPIKISGSVQNVSNDNLAGLKVEISLQSVTPGSAPGRVESPVTPDQVGPSQQGNFQFELDPKMYKGFRISGLKAGDGKDVPYTTPEQQPAPALQPTSAQQP